MLTYEAPMQPVNAWIAFLATAGLRWVMPLNLTTHCLPRVLVMPYSQAVKQGRFCIMRCKADVWARPKM